MAQQLKNLFSPIEVGPFTLRNRIVCTAHGTYYDEHGTGLPGEKQTGYWVSKAKGGIGMIHTEATFAHVHSYRNTFSHPQVVPMFKKAAEAVREHGARLVVQLVHVGVQTQAFPPSFIPWAASVVSGPRDWATPHEMSGDEVREVIDSYGMAAEKLREANMDGVEIGGSHGYIVTQFLSPFFNHRTDEWGGSLENRLRFPLEVIDVIRSKVGNDMMVGLRVNGDDFLQGSNTLEEMLVIAKALCDTGKLDYLSVSAGTYRTFSVEVEPMYYPLGSMVYLAAALKEVVNIPVLARGRINDVVFAEQVLANNQADLVTMTRASITDPDFPNKAKEGKLDEIRKCIGCNEGCLARVLSVNHQSMRCTMNPAVGRETEAGWGEMQSASRSKKVMIVGAGPAGLEAARVAAARGHKVSLYDRGSEIGGQILIASKAPGRDGFLDLPRYYDYQIKTLGIDLHLNTDVTPETVRQAAPDAVVVAAGSIPHKPHIPGIDQPNVAEVRDVLTGKAQVGQNVVVIAGDHHNQGLSVADFLTGLGKKVEVLHEEYSAGVNIEIATRHAVHQRLYQQGIKLSPLTAVKEISGNTVVAYNVLTRQERRIEGVDTVVYAFGGEEDGSLYHALKGQVKELYAVGDCAGVKRVADATRDGAILARRL